MTQVVGFSDQSTGRGTFGGEYVARHCIQWGLYGICMRQCRNAAIYPNYFRQTCYYYYYYYYYFFTLGIYDPEGFWKKLSEIQNVGVTITPGSPRG